MERTLTPELETELRNIFTYHSPEPDQLGAYSKIREGAYVFALTLFRNCPIGDDLMAALRDLRRCVHMANGAVALRGRQLYYSDPQTMKGVSHE